MTKYFKLIKIALIAVFLSSFLFFSIILYILWKYSPELPSYSEIKNYNPPLSTRVFTSDGKLLDKYFIEERLFVPLERIPNKLINAFISAEDKNFYSHIGVDFFAIFRAALTNLINYNSNKRLIGASTITQQVVKNLLLTNEVSIERKIKEIILAIRIENILSKDEILELYLNDIYLGYGSYGVATASLNYFNKSLLELNLKEMAYLAALPKAPNNYHPIKNYENAVERRNWVLDQMFKNRFIDFKDLSLKDQTLVVKNREKIAFSKAEYFKEEVRKELNYLYGSKNLYQEGLVVKTNIDTSFQNIADKALINGIIEYDKRIIGWRGVLENNEDLILSKEILKKYKNPFPEIWELSIIIKVENNEFYVLNSKGETNIVNLNEENSWLEKEKFKKGDIFFIEKINKKNIIRQLPEVNGAIIVMDPHTGKILALTGGFSFKLSEFNRATQAKRQPGSAFKPFVYITALNEGFTPSTLILDAPYVIDQGPGLPKWKPSNYTEEFYGLSTMRIGIEKSRNLMTIRLADRIGMEKILETAKKFDINKGFDSNLSMSLGAGVVTLKNLTNAYAMIANGGKKISPKLIQSVYNKRGKIILNNDKRICNDCFQKNEKLNYNLPTIINNSDTVIDGIVAYQMSSMLEGVVLRGTGKKIASLKTPLAGKTGTTNKNKDAWFIGFSPDLVVGVYIGYDKPKNLGYKQTGSSVAVPIFKDFMKNVEINKNKIPFRIPSGVSFVKIDLQTGLQTNNKNGILEAFKIGTEPFNKERDILDSLGSVSTDTLSGTGNLLIN